MSTIRRGVTMIELAIVLVIIGGVVAMVAPKMVSADAAAKIRSATEVVASYANTARRAALARNAPTRLHVSGNEVWVSMDREDGTSVTVATPVNISTQYASTIEMKRASGTAETQVRFDKRGIARGLANERRLIILQSTKISKRDTVCISGVGMVVREGC